MNEAGWTGGPNKENSNKPTGRKEGYIEIRPLTHEGPGLRVIGFDMGTRKPVPGCIETAMDEDDGLVSAVLDVNYAMKELGYEVVKKYTRYVDDVEEPTQPEQETGDSQEMPKSTTNMNEAQFASYIESEREALNRNIELMRTAEASDDADMPADATSNGVANEDLTDTVDLSGDSTTTDSGDAATS